jgi:hypothetical protein
MKRLLLLVTLLVASTASAATRPYHLQLEAYPAAPFPFLSRFGTVTLHVYPGGVRAETVWLNGFSRSGAPAVTVENPFGRMYTDVPVTEISAVLKKMSKSGIISAAPEIGPQLASNVRGVTARRYRLVYGPAAWIDVWTTDTLPPNPQLRALVNQFVAGIAPASAPLFRAIPGVPLYVELNFRRYQKLPLLRMKSLVFDNAGEEDALKVGALYFRAPLLDSIWK